VKAPSLQTVGLTKRFGDFVALDSVDLAVRPGTVHALLGENGAGKSTLVKCLVGYHRGDAGAVLVDGREREIASPQDARALGLGMVYQHFTLVPSMTVAENLALARGGLAARIDWAAQLEAMEWFMRTTPFVLPLRAPVSRLAAVAIQLAAPRVRWIASRSSTAAAARPGAPSRRGAPVRRGRRRNGGKTSGVPRSHLHQGADPDP